MTLTNSAKTPVTRLLLRSHCPGCTQVETDYTTGGDNARQSATCGGAASCGALRQLSIANTRQRAAAATKAMMPPAGGAATSRAARTARAARPRAADDSPGHLASLAARPERRPWRGWRAAGRGRQHHKHLSEEANGSARVVGLCKSKGHGGAKREKLGNRGNRGLRGGDKQRRRRRGVQQRRECAERAHKEQHVLRPHRYERSKRPSRTKVHLLADTRTPR